MVRYKCSFLMPRIFDDDTVSLEHNILGVVEDNPDYPDLANFGAFINGFWLDENLQLTGSEIGKHWIPPSAIRIITRYTKETERADQWTDEEQHILAAREADPIKYNKIGKV